MGAEAHPVGVGEREFGMLKFRTMVADAPKKDSPAPAMPGGGMGGMDF